MDKREFIKTGLIGVAGLVSVPTIARSFQGNTLSQLNLHNIPYKFDSLSSFLSNRNLESHYTIFEKAGSALYDSLSYSLAKAENIKDVLLNSNNFDSQTIHYANSYLNHKIFFKSLSPESNKLPGRELISTLNSNFGSFENFKSQFEEIALSNRQGEGWVWLVTRNNRLAIISTQKDNNPFSTQLPDEQRGYPLLGLDMWEHAYYLDYENNSDLYVKAFLNNIDWDFVSKRYSRSLQSKI